MDRPEAPPVLDLVPPGPLPFQQIGRYRLVRMIGRGGMGMVFEAIHTDLGQSVALKIIRAFANHDTDQVDRFRREIKAVGTLQHPNIVRATDAGEEAGTLFLVMELLNGVTLDDLIVKHGPLPVPDACELVRQTALGLSAISAKNRVHRDIKPQNLMLVHDAQRDEYLIKILDLGLALFKQEDETVGQATDSRCILGTFDYLSPEQARRSHDVDFRADIYSLGCVFYKLLTGEAPYPSPRYRTYSEKLDAHESKPLPPLPSFVPEEVQRIVQKMTAKQPSLRYQSPRELSDALAPHARLFRLDHLKSSDAEHPSSAKPSTVPSRMGTTDHPDTPSMMVSTVAVVGNSLRRHRWLILLSAMVFSLAAGGWAIWTFGPWHAADPSPAPPAFPVALVPAPKEQPPIVQDAFVEIPMDGPVHDYTAAEQGVVHNLLAHHPYKLLWSKIDVGDYGLYCAGKKTIMTQSRQRCMFVLGKIVAPNYTLSVQLHQTTPLNDVGIFLGYTPAPNATDLRTPDFQLIRINCESAVATKQFSVERFHTCLKWRRKTEAPTVPLSVAAAYSKVAVAKDGVQTLKLVVKRNLLTQVFLNDEEISALTLGQPAAATHGQFGIMHRGAAATFREASIVVNPAR